MHGLHRLADFGLNIFTILLNSVKPGNPHTVLKPSFLPNSKEIENESMFYALSGRINISKELKEFFQSLSLLCSSRV